MSAADLQAQVAELRDERAALVVTRTREDAVRRADAFLETARARTAGVEGFVANGAAVGEPLAAVLQAFALADPRLRDWLVAGQQEMDGVGELTDKAKASRVAKLDTAIAAAEKELREERKREALEEIDRQFSEVA